METLTDLASAYVAARLSLIYEFCGDFEREFVKLRAEVADTINPMLARHGAAPVPADAIPATSEED